MKRFLAVSMIVLIMSQLAWAEFHESSLTELAVSHPHRAEDTGGAITHYVRVMTSEMEPWEARCDAEDVLQRFDAEPVLEALLEHVSKGMPQVPIWNSAGREHDREAPVEWQIYYAVDRSWRYHLRGPPSVELGQLLLGLLPRTETPAGRERVLHDIARHWHPDAEEPLRRLMMDPEGNLGVRRAAGFCLMLHRGEVHHEVLLDLARGAAGEERREWWNLLVDPRHKAETGIDPAVVALGFEILAEERRINPGYVHGAYFVGCSLGGYVNQDFKPDQSRDEYQGEHGLNDAFFIDAVKNALAWWDENRHVDVSSSGLPVDFVERFDRMFLSSEPLRYQDNVALLDSIDTERLSALDRETVRSKLKSFLSVRDIDRGYADDCAQTGVADPLAFLRLRSVQILARVGSMDDVPFLRGLDTLRDAEHPLFEEECKKAIAALGDTGIP
jgi:hypothetical protein